VTAPEAFEFDSQTPRIVFGIGTARSALADEMERLHAHRILVVTTESREALARGLAAPLGDRLSAVFAGAQTHVGPETAEAARRAASQARADAVLSIGGGAATGTAKMVALTTGLPIVAVPTTYAGSEVTPVWGITEEGRKVTGSDPRVLPRCVVYDPTLTRALPRDVSSASGLNAMAHSVEAFWAPRRNPVSNLTAEESIRALSGGLPDVVADPGDLSARSLVMYGAYLAGTAFAATGSGLHHKICHVLGGAFDLPHALTHAVVLPYVVAFNAPAVPELAHRIAEALGADDATVALRSLTSRLALPSSLQSLGMSEDQIAQAARQVLRSIPPDNPRPVDEPQVRAILRAAWEGSPATGEF
jgi:alcohol dehydrogenase class IV